MVDHTPPAAAEADLHTHAPLAVAAGRELRESQRLLQQWLDHLASGRRHDPRRHDDAQRPWRVLLNRGRPRLTLELGAPRRERDPNRKARAKHEERDTR